jgi:hypothetical protein
LGKSGVSVALTELLAAIESALQPLPAPPLLDAAAAGCSQPTDHGTAAAAGGKRFRLAVERLPPQPGDVPFTHACIAETAALLGWRPTTPLAAGLQATLQAMLQACSSMLLLLRTRRWSSRRQSEGQSGCVSKQRGTAWSAHSLDS